MVSLDLLLTICLLYVAALFAIAWYVDREARAGRLAWLRSPVIYTLSISVYCTAWTFYGAVGSAARSGLEFVTIYLGPTLVFVGWWALLRKLVRIGRVHRITSIADMISSRYGKSSTLAVLVTLISVAATTPYIALQLQSVTRSYELIAGKADGGVAAVWIAAGLALFTILFGTRNLDANERHHGVVAAIAVEAVVKLVALIAVGVFAVWGVGGGLEAVFAGVSAETVYGPDVFGARWVAMTFLSATAIVCLPRQFQVTVVENLDERHLATASWLFPLYLLGISLFIVPIALVGLGTLPADSNPDLFVLTLPLQAGRDELALLAFLGGFSAAAAMVIVSTMVSNHVVMPIALRLSIPDRPIGDVRRLLLISRRVSIALILGLGLLYFRLSGGSDALAAIGLVAFVGVAQFLPALLGGLYWRGATRAGALAGLVAGALLWLYTLFLPSFGGGALIGPEVLSQGPWGIGLLRMQALLGLAGLDPLVHALVWSLGANAALFLGVSALTAPRPLERLQGALFVDVFRAGGAAPSFVGGTATADDLFALAERILGRGPARGLFAELARAQGRAGELPLPTGAVLARLERELSGSVGAASAHAMVGRIAGGPTLGMTELFDIADETQRLIETSRALAERTVDLERAAAELRAANQRLRALDSQKDAFLSQVSHELRTPMTSIRSFTEILLGDGPVGAAERRRFLAIIHDEAERLTRLLDEILDISRLEGSAPALPVDAVDPEAAISAALDSVAGVARGVAIRREPVPAGAVVVANEDRLRQVLINLLSNAVKYNAAAEPAIELRPRAAGGCLEIDVIDNGGGVSRDEAERVFERFARGSRAGRHHGAGLGLAISRAIMRAMGGDLTVEFAADGTSFFRLRAPLAAAPEVAPTGIV
jgi:Na+/proline symporter/nitrogen-specific signal transduction histidine kinase